MTKLIITGCCYVNRKGKRCKGLRILNRRTNTFIVINKQLEREIGYKELITCPDSIGNIIMDI